MPSRIFAAVASAALFATVSACKTATDLLPASDITPTRSNSSWCQGDVLLRYAPADRPGQDDPGNQFDRDTTVAAIQEHNARLRAACPDEERK